MTVVLAVTVKGRTRRCNATCHNARKPGCACICGGQNHGQGLLTAAARTAAQADELTARYGADLTSILRPLPLGKENPPIEQAPQAHPV